MEDEVELVVKLLDDLKIPQNLVSEFKGRELRIDEYMKYYKQLLGALREANKTPPAGVDDLPQT